MDYEKILSGEIDINGLISDTKIINGLYEHMIKNVNLLDAKKIKYNEYDPSTSEDITYGIIDTIKLEIFDADVHYPDEHISIIEKFTTVRKSSIDDVNNMIITRHNADHKLKFLLHFKDSICVNAIAVSYDINDRPILFTNNKVYNMYEYKDNRNITKIISVIK